MLKLIGKKISQFYAQKFCLSISMPYIYICVMQGKLEMGAFGASFTFVAMQNRLHGRS